jgi:hypothetical protein
MENKTMIYIGSINEPIGVINYYKVNNQILGEDTLTGFIKALDNRDLYLIIDENNKDLFYSIINNINSVLFESFINDNIIKGYYY